MYEWISRFFWYWEEERIVNIVNNGDEKIMETSLGSNHDHKQQQEKNNTTRPIAPKKRPLKKPSLSKKQKHNNNPLKKTSVPISNKKTKSEPTIKVSDVKVSHVKASNIKEHDPIVIKNDKIVKETANHINSKQTLHKRKLPAYPISTENTLLYEKETILNNEHNVPPVKKEETFHKNDTFPRPIKRKVSFTEMTALFQKFSKALSDHNPVMDKQFEVSYGTYARGLDSDSCDENDLNDLILDTMESIMPDENDDHDEVSIDMTPPVSSMRPNISLDATPITSLTKEDVQIPISGVMNDYYDPGDHEENGPTIHEEFTEYITKYKSIHTALKSKYRGSGDIESRIQQFCAATGSTLNLIEKTAEYIETTTNRLLKMLDEEQKNTLPQTITIRESIIKRSSDIFNFLLCLKKFNQKLMDNLNNAREVLGKIDKVLTHLSKIEYFPPDNIKDCLTDMKKLCEFVDAERTKRIKKLSKVGKERHDELFKEYKKIFDHRKKSKPIPENQPTSVKAYLTNKYLKM